LDTSTVYFYAPVQLPHGVTVTNFTSYWNDEDPSENLECGLYRTKGQHTMSQMADGDSSGYAGYGSTVDISILSAIVDNSQYNYLLMLRIPTTPSYDLEYRFTTIGFAYPT
jgi:hypothetical protein